MAEGERRDNRSSYIYDPGVQGADTNFWSELQGTLVVSGAGAARVLRISGEQIASYLKHRFGRYIFAVSIPAIPAAGTTRLFGLRNPGDPTRGAAYFEQDTTTTIIFTRSYDNLGTLESTSVAADTDWYGREVEFIINWEADLITFSVNDSDGVRVLSTHSTRIGTLPLALEITDTVAENFDVGHIIVDKAEEVI